MARDSGRSASFQAALGFVAPEMEVMSLPAWDCQPYDRVSPHGGILAQRLTTLARLSRLAGSDKPLIVLTTVNAIVQRVPARETVAAQALSVGKELGWDADKVNVNGGAIAIGHPIGASGARILTTLLHEMGKRDAKKGLATLCIGGGMGIAMCVERD